MSYVNDIICKNAMKGWCDQLGKNPKNYLFSFILTIVFNYGIPLILIAATVVFAGNVYVAMNYMDFFSPIFSGISVFYMTQSTVGLMLAGFIVIVAEFLYLVYMMRQLGIYVALPIVAEIVKWLIVVFFKEWIIIAIVLSLIPFMPLAVASHFVSYTFAKGLVIRS